MNIPVILNDNGRTNHTYLKGIREAVFRLVGAVIAWRMCSKAVSPPAARNAIWSAVFCRNKITAENPQKRSENSCISQVPGRQPPWDVVSTQEMFNTCIYHDEHLWKRAVRCQYTKKNVFQKAQEQKFSRYGLKGNTNVPHAIIWVTSID